MGQRVTVRCNDLCCAALGAGDYGAATSHGFRDDASERFRTGAGMHDDIQSTDCGRGFGNKSGKAYLQVAICRQGTKFTEIGLACMRLIKWSPNDVATDTGPVFEQRERPDKFFMSLPPGHGRDKSNANGPRRAGLP